MPHVALNGIAITKAVLHVPNVGPWHVDVELTEAVELATGSVAEFTVGAVTLLGTVAPESGNFGLQTHARIIAGAGGWSSKTPERHYHNDAGVKGFDVATDAARAVGETIGTFPVGARIGNAYVRTKDAASIALEDAAAGVPWYVDYNGVTHVVERPEVAADGELYEVLSHDPRRQIVDLRLDVLDAVGVGSVLTERLDTPVVVRDLRFDITPEDIKVTAWCGAVTSRARIAGALDRIATRAANRKLHGVWKYRVLRMAADRVELQIVNKERGLPDLLPCSMWPGVPGVKASLSPGAEVLVQFIGGDRSQPVITQFVGPGGPGHAAQDLILGGAEGSEAAYKGASVEILMPPMVFNGLIGGAPSSGVMASMTGKAIGAIITGAARVKISPA